MKSRSLFIVVVGAFISLQSDAADHDNLEQGLPTQIEDACPIPFRGREIQSSFSYDRTDEHENRLTLEPRIEFGIAPNTQLTIHAPFYVGNADRTGSGNVGLDALYNFNNESLMLPAFALAAGAEFPTGKDSRGIDTTLKFILTKSITQTGLDRIHFNLAWKHNSGRESDERGDHYIAILGYSRRLNADTILVADFIREQEREKNQETNIVEVGIRRQITPLTVLSFGAGAAPRLSRCGAMLRARRYLDRSFSCERTHGVNGRPVWICSDLEGKKGCDLAVRLGDKSYFVDGFAMNDLGDAHADDGMCNTIRKAKVTGKIVNDRFVASSFELLPVE